MRHILAAIAVSTAFALGGCDDRKEHSDIKVTNDDGTTVTIKSHDGKVVVQSDDRKTVFRSATGEDAIEVKTPDFVPVYPGAKVQTTSSTSTDGGKGGMMIFYSDAAPKQIVAFYKKKAASEGFKETMNMEASGTLMFSASDESSKTGMNVVVREDGGKTMTQVMWSEK